MLLARGITPETAPHALLRLYAGHHMVEAEHRMWENIQPGRGIFIPGGYPWPARFVPWCPALSAWLGSFIPSAGLVDRGEPLARRLHRAAAHLGIALPSNALRRTYAAYRLAFLRDRVVVAAEVGRPITAFRRLLWSPPSSSDAAAFFGLTPEACGRPRWSEEVARCRTRLSADLKSGKAITQSAFMFMGP